MHTKCLKYLTKYTTKKIKLKNLTEKLKKYSPKTWSDVMSKPPEVQRNAKYKKQKVSFICSCWYKLVYYSNTVKKSYCFNHCQKYMVESSIYSTDYRDTAKMHGNKWKNIVKFGWNTIVERLRKCSQENDTTCKKNNALEI